MEQSLHNVKRFIPFAGHFHPKWQIPHLQKHSRSSKMDGAQFQPCFSALPRSGVHFHPTPVTLQCRHTGRTSGHLSTSETCSPCPPPLLLIQQLTAPNQTSASSLPSLPWQDQDPGLASLRTLLLEPAVWAPSLGRQHSRPGPEPGSHTDSLSQHLSATHHNIRGTVQLDGI